MKYLFKVLPIPERSWVKIAIGIAWILEAFTETTIWYAIAPKYLIEIVNPLSIIVFVSTYFAIIVGAIHLGLGLAGFIQWFKKWRGYLE